MKRCLIPILVVSTLVVGFALGCNGVQPSVTPSSQQSSLQTTSTPSEYQQQINELEQHIHLLNERVAALEEKMEQTVTDNSSVEARIEQQSKQLGEQIDELNAEVVAVKQQLAERGSQEQTMSSPSPPEAPSGTIFTFSGQGNSRSLPFSIGSSPWKLMVWFNEESPGKSVNIEVVDPTQYDPSLIAPIVGAASFDVEQGISIRETILYVPAGTYFLEVGTRSTTTWTVWVIEL